MAKWRKRLLLLALFLGVFAGTLCFTAWWMAHGRPEWYQSKKLDPRESEAAAARAEQQLQQTLSWAQDRQAESVRQARSAPATQPAQALEITLTEDELNSFFQKWDSTFGWSGRYSRYLSDPQVVLLDGRLILAATVADAGTVLSVEFQPRLAEGEFYLPVTRVLAGRLPLPRPLWDRYRARLETRLKSNLSQWQHDAQITRQGANMDAIAAAMAELLLDALDDRPAPPVLFLPYDMRRNPRSLPVSVTGVRIADKTLTLTIEPMDGGQRDRALSAIRNFSCEPSQAMAISKTR
jgi:hypothetical protein